MVQQFVIISPRPMKFEIELSCCSKEKKEKKEKKRAHIP
jgi:hypothetical protein